MGFSAKNLKDHGESYLLSSDVLFKNIEHLGSHRFAPAYFNVAHSIELFLKSYLMACEKSERVVIGFNHDLEALIEACKKEGFVLSYSNENDIRQLYKYTKGYQFTYPEMGVKTLPDLGSLIEISQSILASLEEVEKKEKAA